jgi:hypothetical protein
MSLLDRLKSFFSSGSGAPEEIVGRADDAGASAVPPTPVDPLGTPAPEAAPDPVTPPPPPSDPDQL